MLKMRISNPGSLPAGNQPRIRSRFGPRFRQVRGWQAFRFVTGWCGLLIFAGSYSPFGLGTAALVGSLDPAHHAMVYNAGQGAQLVLHHDRNCLHHQHGVAARVLTFFSMPASSVDPDHVIQFGSLESVQEHAQITAPPLTQDARLSLALIEAPAWSAAEQFCFARFHPPPEHGGRLICVRSTLLLL
jgi:hypothetical protein